MDPSDLYTSSGASALPKINRVETSPLSPEMKTAERSTKAELTDLVSREDYLNIYRGLNVVFIGDNSIRTLYRDAAKMLQFGRLLDYTEVSRQNGKYDCMQGETTLTHEGKISSNEYRDVKQFVLPENSTKLVYIHLATLFDNKATTDALNSLKSVPGLQTIDAVFFCSFTADMSEKKLQDLKVPVDRYFKDYLENLEKFSSALLRVCREKCNKQAFSCWVAPYPSNPTVYEQQGVTFGTWVQDMDAIVEGEDFIKLDRFDVWCRMKNLVISEHGNFSLHGIRFINDKLVRLLATQFQRSCAPLIPMTATPLTEGDNHASREARKLK